MTLFSRHRLIIIMGLSRDRDRIEESIGTLVGVYKFSILSGQRKFVGAQTRRRFIIYNFNKCF